MPSPDLAESAEHEANEVLARAAETVGHDGGILIETAAVHGHAATVLAEQASGATMLVVGTRGHGALATLMLGSVSKALAHDCPVPLAIVPS